MNTKYQMLPTAGSARKNEYPFRQRPVSIITTLLDEEREEMEELSVKAKEGHPIGQNYCEMCNEKSRPCWTPHLLRYPLLKPIISMNFPTQILSPNSSKFNFFH